MKKILISKRKTPAVVPIDPADAPAVQDEGGLTHLPPKRGRGRPPKPRPLVPPPKKKRGRPRKQAKQEGPESAVRQSASAEDSDLATTKKRLHGDDGRFLAKYSATEAGQRQRESANRRIHEGNIAIRDIANNEDGPLIDFNSINWERRLACELDLRLFIETYLLSTFQMFGKFQGWSGDQLRCISKAQRVFLDGGKFAIAMPRGGGKSTICRATIIWGTAYALRKSCVFIGSSDDRALQTLESVKTIWYRNQLLYQDFPEIAYPIMRLENRWHAAAGQMYKGQPTHVEWKTNCIRYPILLLRGDDAKPYLDNNPRFLRYLPEYDGYITDNSWVCVNTTGITGGIRGDAVNHPYTLEVVRPDLVLLDDIQKDQTADSPATCAKMVRLIDGAVQGLAGPGQQIAALMPCTVIREEDVSDTYLDTVKKPDWDGERCSMVISWPDGITDFDITMETEEGKHWNQYNELRKQSLREFKDIRLATQYYRTNREAMDRNFIVSWSERYTKENRNPYNIELSAQQHAMNLRLSSPDTFPSEYQNRGRRLYTGTSLLITPRQLTERVVDVTRRHVMPDCHILTAFIDVQQECNFYTVLGVNTGFDGVITEYGTWPEITTRNFIKAQTLSWSLSTREFFKAYPHLKDKATRTEGGKLRAPFEAKIYHALRQTVLFLNSLVFVRDDPFMTEMKIKLIGIDTKWGDAGDPIKRFITESGFQNLVPCQGQSFPPIRKQLEEYRHEPGFVFENDIHPHIKEPMWVIRPNAHGQVYLQPDTDRAKDFVFSRLGCPLGSPGSIALYQAMPEHHEMFATSVCSEYPEPLITHRLTKNMWQARSGRQNDNDYLDCLVGCCCLASYAGASIKSRGDTPVVSAPRRSLREKYDKKRMLK